MTLVQRREHHELVSGLLWLGLWPGLDAVYRRRQRNFRGQPEELIAELADVFTGIIERLDLEVVHRVAATLVRSTARDLIDRRRRVGPTLTGSSTGTPSSRYVTRTTASSSRATSTALRAPSGRRRRRKPRSG